MKVLATIISVCLALFFMSSGCSQEEQAPVQETRVMKPIKVPVQQEVEKTLTAEKSKPEPEGIGVEKEEQGKEEQEIGQEQKKEAEAVKTAAIEEKTIKPPETMTKEKEMAKEVDVGYYLVKKEDSLSRVSGRKDVYGDPLKWPILYRLNMDKLGHLPLGKNFPDRRLPDSVEKLEIVTPDEAKRNLEKRANKLWVVNVLSTTNKSGKIVKDAVKLMKNGYPVYFTRARVKGKEWVRLRVGFYENKSDALKAGKEIRAMLNLADSWAAKITKKELEEFGSY